MVIWFIGLSGSGKTTLGNKLFNYRHSHGLQSFLIDGDQVRDFYDNDLGYSREDRVANIKRIMLAAYALSRVGIVPIVCNISPFEELRQFARRKLYGYTEIYLKRDLVDLQKANVNQVYQGTDVVGQDMAFDEPKYPDLVIDTGKESPEESFKRVLDLVKERL